MNGIVCSLSETSQAFTEGLWRRAFLTVTKPFLEFLVTHPASTLANPHAIFFSVQPIGNPFWPRSGIKGYSAASSTVFDVRTTRPFGFLKTRPSSPAVTRRL